MKRTLVTAVMLITLLTSCIAPTNTLKDEVKPVRIGIYGEPSPQMENFQHNFGEYLDFAVGDLKYEFVYMGGHNPQAVQHNELDIDFENTIQNVKETLNGPNPPDIIICDSLVFTKLIEENMLSPLDTYIQKDNFDISEIDDKVIQTIRRLGGGGQLYGLAPVFDAKVLLYNKEIFDRAGVPYPHNNMTWEELFVTARLVSNAESEMYGLTFLPLGSRERLIYDISVISDGLELSLYDATATQMTVDNEEWASVLDQLRSLYEDQALDLYVEENIEKNRNGMGNFFNGKTAMKIADVIDYKDLVMKGGMEGVGVVSVPSFTDTPNVGSGVYLKGNIMGINVKSPNAEGAWEVIKALNGEEWAKLKYKYLGDAIVSRYKQVTDPNMVEFINAFNSKSDAPGYSLLHDILGNPHLESVNDAADRTFADIITGKKQSNEGLKELDDIGKLLLDRASVGKGSPALHDALIINEKKYSLLNFLEDLYLFRQRSFSAASNFPGLFFTW